MNFSCFKEQFFSPFFCMFSTNDLSFSRQKTTPPSTATPTGNPLVTPSRPPPRLGQRRSEIGTLIKIITPNFGACNKVMLSYSMRKLHFAEQSTVKFQYLGWGSDRTRWISSHGRYTLFEVAFLFFLNVDDNNFDRRHSDFHRRNSEVTNLTSIVAVPLFQRFFHAIIPI